MVVVRILGLLLGVTFQTNLAVIAQSTNSNHILQIGPTIFVQSRAGVIDRTGPLSHVIPKPSAGINIGMTYKYLFRKRRHWIGAGFEIGVFRPSILVKIPELTLPSGEVVPAYSHTVHPGFISDFNWYWTLLYGRSITHGNVMFEPYIGLGTVETEIISLNSSLGAVSDSTHRGVISLDLSYRKRRTFTFRLGVDLLSSKEDRSRWSLGLITVISLPYITGGYILLPNTIYESYGRFTGTMSYAGIRIVRLFHLSKRTSVPE